MKVKGLIEALQKCDPEADCYIDFDNGEEHWFQPREMSLEQEEHAPLPSPVTHFEVGHWYKWIGPKVRPVGWNSRGKMDFILDGEPHQCTQRKDLNVAIFDNRPVPETVNGGRGMWFWGPLENFQEVDMGPKGDGKKLRVLLNSSLKYSSNVEFGRMSEFLFPIVTRRNDGRIVLTPFSWPESRASIRKRLLGI